MNTENDPEVPDYKRHASNHSGSGAAEAAGTDEDESPVVLSDKEERTAQEQAEPSAPVVFEIVRRDGERELRRPAHSLWFSGVAAGLAIGFSVFAQALLRESLPAADWAIIVEKLGYCVGFILIINARLQLFTENTITAVVPVVLKPNRRTFVRTARLWAVVLSANVLGAALFAVFASYGAVSDDALYQAMLEISRHAVGFAPVELIARGTIAGFLIAMLVWIMASMESDKTLMIILITYLVALGDFAHVIAGSVEAVLLVISGDVAPWEALSRFFLPTLLGNVVGGSLIFTMLVYAQIHREIKHGEQQ